MSRSVCIAATLVATSTFGSAHAAVIRPADSLIETTPGSQISVLWLIEDVQDPLFGYSLDLDVSPASLITTGGAGSISVNVGLTNFFDSRNLIVAGGGVLDPFFSVIVPDGSGGVFLSTNSDDGSTYLPSAGVNDVLAEIVIDISGDALGEFTISSGIGSALSDAQGFPVAFQAEDLTIRVVPTQPTITIAGLCTAGAMRRRRRM